MISKEMLYYISTEDLLRIVEDIKCELRTRKKRDSQIKRREFIATLSPDKFGDNERTAFNIQAEYENSSKTLAIRNINDPYTNRLRYLDALISQDWSHIYPENGGKNNFYVYAHVDPSAHVFVQPVSLGGNYGGEPFYIGKGTGQRAFDLKRNEGHGKKLRSVLERWEPEDVVHICFEGLTEAKALEIESKLIYFFGTVYQLQRKGVLYNLDVPRVPEFIGTMVKYQSRNMWKAVKEVV